MNKGREKKERMVGRFTRPGERREKKMKGRMERRERERKRLESMSPVLMKTIIDCRKLCLTFLRQQCYSLFVGQECCYRPF